MKRLVIYSVLAIYCFASCSKLPANKNNFVLIQAGDSEETIIRKAATLAPSPRQLRWQQLELTAFFHFGINTFTNKEWGTGKEDPQLFNPTALDADLWVRVAKD